MPLYEDSRYLETSAFRNEGELTLLLRKRPTFNINDMKTYTWIKGDTIDGVSSRLYNNDRLWWAIMDANPKYQSELDIKEGDILLIPAYDEVVDLVGFE